MGNPYLTTVCGGGIRKKDRAECLMIEDDKHARRMTAPYEKWMETTEKGRRELPILRMMWLFDRPAGPAAIRALLAESEIKGLTGELCGLSDVQWMFTLKNLREMRLILDPTREADGGEMGLGEMGWVKWGRTETTY